MPFSLSNLMTACGIDRFAVLSFSDVRVTKSYILEKEDFIPKTVLLFLLPYYTGETVNLSRYAASLDYHLCIKEYTETMIQELKKEFPGASFRGYGDHSPIDERHAALIGGLGIAGDNGLLIDKEYGSYVFIADIITDLSPETLGAKDPCAIETCEHCGACSAACPTGILRGCSDACLSAVTQKKGDLTDSEASLMEQYHTVWGCDACQCYCPHNQSPKRTPISFFYQDRIEELTLESLDAMSDEAFQKRAFAWRGRNTVRRNLCLAKSWKICK